MTATEFHLDHKTPVEPEHGRLVENIMHFTRVLRDAGLPIGPGKVIEAVKAVEIAGLASRQDFYWVLHSVLINRRDQREIFDQAFHLFWRNPKILERMLGMMLPKLDPGTREPEDDAVNRRVSEAFYKQGNERGKNEAESKETELEFDATLTWSERERLQAMDFESMSAVEMAQAKKAIAQLKLPIMDVPVRRFRPNPRGGRVDMRATMRASMRFGGGIIPLRRKQQLRRHPPLVVLCDISGSMSRYSRMFLLFLHAITNDRDRVHTFLFGTRLTNVTRHLRQRDIDLSLLKVGAAAPDWEGGTRIGHVIEEFNRLWSRRVLGQGAVVLLITDGLDRDAASGLSKQMERLHKSCRRLIWLNPLLRWEGFEARSLGAKAILPHVDEFRSVHNLQSLQDLASVLSRPKMQKPEGNRNREVAA
jgi:uncharacterized protein with von Willebrand factor type A (vWA) domain